MVDYALGAAAAVVEDAPNPLIDVYRSAIGQQSAIPNDSQCVNLPLGLRQG